MRGEKRDGVKRHRTGKILREKKAGSKVKLIGDSAFQSKKSSGLILSHEHRNAINKVEYDLS